MSKEFKSTYEAPFYIIERDLGTAQTGPMEELYSGPWFDSHEAWQECPDDGDGKEYSVERLTDWELEERFD